MEASDHRSLVARPLGPRGLVLADGLTVVVYLLVLLGTVSGLVVRDGGGVPGWAMALLAGAVLPVALRRVWPVPVFAVSLSLSLAALFLGVSREPLAAAAFALYPVALTAGGPRRLPTAAVGVVSVSGLFLVTAVGTTESTSGWVGPLLVGAGFLGVSWTVGRAVRERRSYAERSARRLAERAVTDERLRIARELHDVVAHGMSVIAVKSGVAAHLLGERQPRDPVEREARDALRVIEGTSRAALTEMRHLLGVLRAGEAVSGPEMGAGGGLELAPVPGLSGLAGLADRARLAGVEVRLRVACEDALPDGVELAAYRIVQEALTNVVRHAAPARCRVALWARGGELGVEVVDDGPGVRVLPAPPGGGHGLIGMRERVGAYGGTLETGPQAGGGFAVRARLPYEPVPAAGGEVV